MTLVSTLHDFDTLLKSSCNYFMRSYFSNTIDTVTFSSCKSWFNFSAVFLKVWLFSTSWYFPTNVFQFGLLKFFVIIHEFYQCITVLLMLIPNCITKKQLVNVTLCFSCFRFFWNYESCHNFWCWCKSYKYMCDFLMYQFPVVLTWRFSRFWWCFLYDT